MLILLCSLKQKVMLKTILVLLILFLPVSLIACPFCTTDTASEIRAQIFGSDFLINLFTGISPFIVFGIITAAIYKSGKNLK